MACSAVRSSGGVQVKIKSNPDEFWDAIFNSTKLFPTAIPSLYTTISTSNADGTVRYIKYGQDSPRIKQSEEQINESQKPKFSYTVLSGDILKYYTSFRAEISIVLNEDGAWAKWTWETDFPKANNPLDIGVDLEELAVKTLGKLDDYVVRA
ncbi:hypothetical protein P3X46_015363 [Hevea brasiliensis]|uniref:Bet v I/Major latex protein domain-containing protein n=1 Tax=Hevea brasiliensis TaxID=3981 RepID=A0ABQ9LVW4_HEVBR|nr:MLP-like protein 423 [Hevea brasiliensis]KAJ9172076.1 hypothetical protein P3X46_015363 [Hevea brasiliensis]